MRRRSTLLTGCSGKPRSKQLARALSTALTRRLGDNTRVRAFGQFVRLHRRHVRRQTHDDGELAWDENVDGVHRKTRASEVGVAAAVRALPLELREALLIVVLAGFTHQEAAIALDLSLATLIARLTKARERVAASTCSFRQRRPGRLRICESSSDGGLAHRRSARIRGRLPQT